MSAEQEFFGVVEERRVTAVINRPANKVSAGRLSGLSFFRRDTIEFLLRLRSPASQKLKIFFHLSSVPKKMELSGCQLADNKSLWMGCRTYAVFVSAFDGSFGDSAPGDTTFIRDNGSSSIFLKVSGTLHIIIIIIVYVCIYTYTYLHTLHIDRVQKHSNQQHIV